ncbi:MAG TPA: tripartite tricarboxylate transporter TctB family protein [Trueperaceae bacterium]
MSDSSPPAEALDSRQQGESPVAPSPRPLLGDLFMSLGVLALGTYFVVGAFNIRVLPSYARIGPRFFPLLVAGGLLLCGLLLLLQALRGQAAPPEETEDVDVAARPNWLAVAVLAAALLADVLLIERLGFVLASTLLFWGVAFGFGSRFYLRDVLAGLVLSLVAYLAFTRLLDLTLPAGILPLATRLLAGP